MKLGIIGHESEKFTLETRKKARDIIWKLTEPADVAVVSGHCHLGGVDIWAEEIAQSRGKTIENGGLIVHAPEVLSWEQGYRPRNLKIANDSDLIHVIVVREYPPHWKQKRWRECYHCHTRAHVKSGACWTAWKAIQMGKEAVWHIV